MSNEVMSLADEIMCGSDFEPLSRSKVRAFLTTTYRSDKETIDAVIAVLDGEGYWG